MSPHNHGSMQVYEQLAYQQRPHQSSSTQLSKIEEKIQGRGMCRSSASYGIQQMLQEQVVSCSNFLMRKFANLFDSPNQIARDDNNTRTELERELACVVANYEERINNLKLEHNLQLQQGLSFCLEILR